MGKAIGMLGGYGFQGQVAAGDGSDKQGKMGAGYNNLRRQKKKQQCKVGREEEGSSSNQPELAAFFLALRDTLIEKPLLYLCDNQSLLKAVTRWNGEGGKATLAGASDADILAAAIEILRKRIAAGTATFLVKVLQQNTWIDDRFFLKSCVRARAEQDNINHPAYGTWTADFMLRQNESRAFIGKYLNNPRVPWRHKRREMMAIAGIILVAKWLAKIKQ